MSSGPARYEEVGDLKNPKPSFKISSTPSPSISSPSLEWDFNILNITSCFFDLAIFSIPMSSAIPINSSMGLALSSPKCM